jgi:hypothetical protein
MTTPSVEEKKSAEEVKREYHEKEGHYHPAPIGVEKGRFEEASNSSDGKRSFTPDDVEVRQEETEEVSSAPGGGKKRRTFAQKAMAQTRRASVPDFLKPDPKLVSFGSKVKAFLAREANFYVSAIEHLGWMGMTCEYF